MTPERPPSASPAQRYARHLGPNGAHADLHLAGSIARSQQLGVWDLCISIASVFGWRND